MLQQRRNFFLITRSIKRNIFFFYYVFITYLNEIDFPPVEKSRRLTIILISILNERDHRQIQQQNWN